MWVCARYIGGQDSKEEPGFSHFFCFNIGQQTKSTGKINASLIKIKDCGYVNNYLFISKLKIQYQIILYKSRRNIKNVIIIPNSNLLSLLFIKS